MATMPRALIISALLRASSAILVAEDSPCSTSCGNALSSTPLDDLVCSENDYAETSQGTVFKNCVTCQSTSTFTNPEGEPATSDLQAMLYNMRLALSHCVFETDSNPCLTTTACGPLRDALQHENLAPNATAYGYCSVWNRPQVEHCSACLVHLDGGVFLNNYLQVLHGACDLLLQPPATIPLDGEIFSTTEQVNVTQPTPTSTFNSDARVGKLSYGAVAGIAIGAVVVLLIIMGCFVVLQGKRKRKAYLRRREKLRTNWPSGGGVGEMFETPVSQQPLRGWGDSPISATTDRSYPQYFSPYTSQYNSPVSGAEGPSHMHMAWPVEKAQSIGVAVGPDNDGAMCWTTDGKGKEKAGAGADADGEGYELQEGIYSGGGHQHPPVPPPPPRQAPMLNHPGYGRGGLPPPAPSAS